MAQPFVLHDFSEGVDTLTMARPEAGNAMDLDFAEALHDAAGTACSDPRTRAVLI